MPSKNKKQQRFMGMQLAKQRKSGHNDTGMNEKQLSEFAGSVEGCLEDITFHENAAKSKTVVQGFVHPVHKGYDDITFGELDAPAIDDMGVKQFTPGKQSCNRDTGQGVHYGAEVDYFGPDTNYRAEEIDPHQYGSAWEPYPFRDYFKTEDKVHERGFRMREQDEYDETRTPGAVTDDQPMSQAYGAVNYRGAGPKRDVPDYRSFESQRDFRRHIEDKSEKYRTDTDGFDTREGDDIQ